MTEVVVGKYVINMADQIGSGAYGKVYSCKKIDKLTTTEPKVEYCAKVFFNINQIIQIFGQQEKEVKNEEKILEIIQKYQSNENLVRVYHQDYDSSGNKLRVIMERCDYNLKYAFERKQKSFDDDEFLDFLIQFINGYQVLYDNNIIHRDLKPENILVIQGKRNIYKIADFGTGKIYKSNDQLITKKGTVVYSGPELQPFIKDSDLDSLLSNKKEAHFKSKIDIYCLGIMLHQLYLKCFPFQPVDEQQIENFINNLKGQIFKIQPVDNKSPEILKLIESMIQYYPEKRISWDDIKIRCNQLKSNKYSSLKSQLPFMQKQNQNQPNFNKNFYSEVPQSVNSIPQSNQNQKDFTLNVQPPVLPQNNRSKTPPPQQNYRFANQQQQFTQPQQIKNFNLNFRFPNKNEIKATPSQTLQKTTQFNQQKPTQTLQKTAQFNPQLQNTAQFNPQKALAQQNCNQNCFNQKFINSGPIKTPPLQNQAVNNQFPNNQQIDSTQNKLTLQKQPLQFAPVKQVQVQQPSTNEIIVPFSTQLNAAYLNFIYEYLNASQTYFALFDTQAKSLVNQILQIMSKSEIPDIEQFKQLYQKFQFDQSQDWQVQLAFSLYFFISDQSVPELDLTDIKGLRDYFNIPNQ